MPDVPFDLARMDIAGHPVVVVYGELDALNSPKLHEALTQVLVENPSVVLVDMANVTFMDSSGLGALVVSHRRLHEAGGELRLVAVPEGPARVFDITGMAEFFRSYSDADSATKPTS